jgi:hypothetical protein
MAPGRLLLLPLEMKEEVLPQEGRIHTKQVKERGQKQNKKQKNNN